LEEAEIRLERTDGSSYVIEPFSLVYVPVQNADFAGEGGNSTQQCEDKTQMHVIPDSEMYTIRSQSMVALPRHFRRTIAVAVLFSVGALAQTAPTDDGQDPNNGKVESAADRVATPGTVATKEPPGAFKTLVKTVPCPRHGCLLVARLHSRHGRADRRRRTSVQAVAEYE
jgi:hypothetical protein